MAGSAPVLTDRSPLSLADQVFHKLESLLTLMGGIVILLLVFLATANILGRWIFSLPVNGYVDWVEQAMAFLAFLGISYTQREGGHIRMDILVTHLHGRLLWAMELISTLIMLAITLVLIYGSSLHFLRAYSIGDSSLDINLPTWPAKLVVPISLTILALRLLLQCWGYARAIRKGGDSPVGVPLVEDAASLAKAEAESIMGEGVAQNTGKPS
jgi:TRAP-type C4-dicarboxylate transport system permease small subunit